jgi:hypothetical protein
MNRNRLLGSSNDEKKIIVFMAIVSLSIIVTAALSPFAQIQVAGQKQENNINNNNSIPKLSLSTISTAVGTGAAATGAIVTVPGVLRTRKQSKFLSTYLLKIHDKYDEFSKKTKPANNKKYLDFFEALRSEIIFMLQRREINENQYKMLDDRIIEYLNKVTDLK